MGMSALPTRYQSEDGAVFLRALNQDDFKEFRLMRIQALEQHPGYFCAKVDDARSHPDSYWLETLDGQGKCVFGLFDSKSDKMVGITAVFTWREDPSGTTGVMAMSYIAPDYRGKGYADLFYEARIDFAKEHKPWTQLTIGHRAGNERSRKAMLRHGFIFTHKKLIQWPDGTEDFEGIYKLDLHALRDEDTSVRNINFILHLSSIWIIALTVFLVIPSSTLPFLFVFLIGLAYVLAVISYSRKIDRQKTNKELKVRYLLFVWLLAGTLMLRWLPAILFNWYSFFSGHPFFDDSSIKAFALFINTFAFAAPPTFIFFYLLINYKDTAAALREKSKKGIQKEKNLSFILFFLIPLFVFCYSFSNSLIFLVNYTKTKEEYHLSRDRFFIIKRGPFGYSPYSRLDISFTGKYNVVVLKRLKDRDALSFFTMEGMPYLSELYSYEKLLLPDNEKTVVEYYKLSGIECGKESIPCNNKYFVEKLTNIAAQTSRFECVYKDKNILDCTADGKPLKDLLLD